jgi:hypothetical protein
MSGDSQTKRIGTALGKISAAVMSASSGQRFGVIQVGRAHPFFVNKDSNKFFSMKSTSLTFWQHRSPSLPSSWPKYDHSISKLFRRISLCFPSVKSVVRFKYVKYSSQITTIVSAV